MFLKLLEAEEISHNVKPVRDYGALAEIYVDDVIDSEELRNVLLINCGSVIDLWGHLQERLDALDGEGGGRRVEDLPHPDCRWYVLDSHRPHNLQNASRLPEQLCVFDDAAEPSEEMEHLLAQEHILLDEEFEHEDEDEDEAASDKRRKLSPDEYQSMSPDSRASQYHALKALERKYYSASWHATSSAVVAYELVQKLGKRSNELLWLAVVGLTDQLVHERVQFGKYEIDAGMLQSEAESLNDSSGDVASITDESSGVTVSVTQHITSSMRLTPVQELRLCMLRHWSLYEALQHSTYIASRLGLSSAKGRDKLNVWLARMAIPLHECRQSYVYMKPELREELFDKMLQFGPEFGVMDLTYPTLQRTTNYAVGTTVTAADLVYAIDAQLESGEQTVAADADVTVVREAEDSATAEAFSRALTTLEHGAREGSQKDGMERAKRQLKALVSQGNAIITQRQFQRMGDFYKVIMKPGTETEHFTQVQALTKLGLFVADALREAAKQKGDAGKQKGDAGKPLLIAVPKKGLTYLVVAVLGSSRYWKDGAGKSGFGHAFLKTAHDPQHKARIKHESFESSVCEVAKDDLDNFLDGVVLNYTEA